MKSHDYHVLMTQILPVAIRGIMDAHVREMLFGLCNFFDVISRKSVKTLQMQADNLQMQDDNARDFMTITKDGGFIHAPVPESSRK